MLGWSLVFFLIAIAAAIFGFTSLAVGAAGVAKVLFFVFLVLWIVSMVRGLLTRRRAT